MYSANSSYFGDDETEHSFADEFWVPWEASFDNHFTAGLSSWTFSRASSSVAVEPSPLGKRQRDSTASEEGKSQATHNATMEEVDKEKDEEEDGNDINQVRKRPKVTCGQKSNSVGPSNDSEEATLAVGTAHTQVQQFNFAIQQGEVIAGNNPAASDVAVTIDRAITDGAMNDATALSQDDETTRLAAFHIADPTVAATSAIGPIHLNPYTIAKVADQAQPPVPQPTATIGVDIAAATRLLLPSLAIQPWCNQDQPQMPTIGVDISAATNKTEAPESSDPALVQTRPTSNVNQDFVQDVESQEKETEPTSFETENGKGKIMVQSDVGMEKF